MATMESMESIGKYGIRTDTCYPIVIPDNDDLKALTEVLSGSFYIQSIRKHEYDDDPVTDTTQLCLFIQTTLNHGTTVPSSTDPIRNVWNSLPRTGSGFHDTAWRELLLCKEHCIYASNDYAAIYDIVKERLDDKSRSPQSIMDLMGQLKCWNDNDVVIKTEDLNEKRRIIGHIKVRERKMGVQVRCLLSDFLADPLYYVSKLGVVCGNPNLVGSWISKRYNIPDEVSSDANFAKVVQFYIDNPQCRAFINAIAKYETTHNTSSRSNTTSSSSDATSSSSDTTNTSSSSSSCQ